MAKRSRLEKQEVSDSVVGVVDFTVGDGSFKLVLSRLDRRACSRRRFRGVSGVDRAFAGVIRAQQASHRVGTGSLLGCTGLASVLAGARPSRHVWYLIIVHQAEESTLFLFFITGQRDQ